ncbi:MAG: chorismate-binding protein [Bacteroidia bacterium]
MSGENPVYIYFRLPRNKKIYFAYSQLSTKPVSLSNLPKKQQSFVLSPFNYGNKVYAANLSNVKAVTNNFKPTHEFYFLSEPKIKHDDYIKNVNSIIDLLKSKNKLQKVVLARTKLIPYIQKDIFGVFEKICNSYPKNFCYLVSSKKTGTLIGASPEVLLDYKNDVANTVALAGTKKNSDTKWSNKEYNEQLLVQQHIENQLKLKNIKFKKSKTTTVKSGNLFHLVNKFSFKINYQKLPEVIKSLNPTPAVAGLPVKKSIDIIKTKESFSREFYSGFIGLHNFNKRSCFYVNLRCASLFKNKLLLFAGAGITADSNAEKEYIETQNKMLAIEQFFV